MASGGKNKIRVWFNHWFSTAYHLINLMRESEHFGLYVIGTNENETAVYKNACDEWYTEPKGLDDGQYVDFCIQFCAEHGIDVFVPKKKLLPVLKSRGRFEEKGIKLFGEKNWEAVEWTEDKQRTYERLAEIVPDIIPEYRIASSVEQFIQSFRELSETGYRVCYKLVCDEGAASFRVIDDSIETAKGLREKPGCKLTFSSALKVLEGYSFDIPILQMPYLSGVECSADCCRLSGGESVIIPRFKTNKRYSEVREDRDIEDACRRIMDSAGFEMPVNIQFRYEGGRFYLLEVNARMSGGLQLSCLGSNINIPALALEKLFGIECGKLERAGECRKVVHIETPICIQ